MKNIKKIILAVCLTGFLLATLSACGRYSEPSPIEGSNFPHKYPHSKGEPNV